MSEKSDDYSWAVMAVPAVDVPEYSLGKDFSIDHETHTIHVHPRKDVIRIKPADGCVVRPSRDEDGVIEILPPNYLPGEQKNVESP